MTWQSIFVELHSHSFILSVSKDQVRRKFSCRLAAVKDVLYNKPMDEGSSEKGTVVGDAVHGSHNEFIASAEQETIDKERLAPIGQTIHNDITRATDGSGQITPTNIGTVLGRLRNEVEAGISLDQRGIKVFSSVAEVLPADLSEAMQNNVVYHNQPIEREDWGEGIKATSFKDEVLSKFFDGDAYEAALDFNRKLYSDKADVKLVRYGGTLVTVTEHMAGDQLRIIQVFGCDFPQTVAYREFRRKVREENVDPTNWTLAKDKKENYIPVHHLIIENIKSGKAIDLGSLLPDDWALQYLPTTTPFFSQDSDKKHLKCSEISSPELLVGALHEYGHCIADANNPQLFREAKELWEGVRFQTGGPRALPPEVFNRTKELLVQNERGASARALQVLRILGEQGLETGVSIKDISRVTNEALSSYERNYPNGTTSFIRGREAA